MLGSGSRVGGTDAYQDRSPGDMESIKLGKSLQCLHRNSADWVLRPSPAVLTAKQRRRSFQDFACSCMSWVPVLLRSLSKAHKNENQ